MSVDWARQDQPTFDRIVEALVRHRFGDRVRAVNGRGGDDGIDIEITLEDGRLWILQLKFYPEGFSSVWGKRRTEIRKSFKAAREHSPAKWTLVVPCLCTNPENKFVTNLNGGTQPPKITVIDRDDLDGWLADAPAIDAYVQRNATSELRQMARDFNQERAALLGGVPDLAERIRNLGSVVDAVDLDWAVDFARRGDTTSVTVRPRDPDAPVRSPIGFTVEMNQLGEEHADLGRQLLRNIGFATSEPVQIPGGVVRSVRFDGPEFIAGEYPPGAVEINKGSIGPAVGRVLELRAFRDNTMMASYDGRITHAARGSFGGSIEAEFCGGHLAMRLRLPHDVESAQESSAFPVEPGIDLRLNYDAVQPSVVEEVLSTRRVLRFATRLEARVNGELLTAVRPAGVPQTAEDYDTDLLAIEEFAHDLDVVQRHTRQFFDIPEAMQPGDRVKMRVARLLIGGYIVASPRARNFTLEMTGADTPEVRAQLTEPRPIVWPAGPYAVTAAGRELIIGDVYAVHPQATAINGEKAIAALDAGEAQGFHVHFRPGDDPFFYLTLADVPPDKVHTRLLAQWTLHGVDQPGVADENSAAQSA